MTNPDPLARHPLRDAAPLTSWIQQVVSGATPGTIHETRHPRAGRKEGANDCPETPPLGILLSCKSCW